MTGQSGRVVVGYDGSTQATHAVEWAAREAARRGNRLTVLCVIERDGLPSGSDRGAGVDATPVVERGIERAGEVAPEVQVSGEVKPGRPAGALVEASRAADLVVVGTRGRGALRTLAQESVAAAVPAQASCPVVVVRGDGTLVPGPAHPVVVGLDGSPASQAALGYAAGAAENAAAPLVVVRAWNDVARYSRWVGIDGRVVIARDDLLGKERELARADLRAAKARVCTRFPDAKVIVVLAEGAPAPALLDVGADAGLIVVGTHGHGALTRLLNGSVSRTVVQGSTRPVAVVRAGIATWPGEAELRAPDLTGAPR